MVVTLIAFASNSLLCRRALSGGAIGPIEFTIVRLVSGAIMLLPFLILASTNARQTETNRASRFSLKAIASSLFLFSYAICFSLAYIGLHASVGALILFAAVQFTMMGGSHLLGGRANVREWVGLGLAFGGLVYLLLPGLTAPPLGAAILMIVAGMSWGVYSLLGKGNPRPVLATSMNFLLTVPWCVIAAIVLISGWSKEAVSYNAGGLILAVVSGAIASGLGYVLWYISLRHISVTTASIAQLSVPILAGIGGIVFLGESASLRLLIASVVIVGGIVVAIVGRRKA